MMDITELKDQLVEMFGTSPTRKKPQMPFGKHIQILVFNHPINNMVKAVHLLFLITSLQLQAWKEIP
jgi:hypothetical protein